MKCLIGCIKLPYNARKPPHYIVYLESFVTMDGESFGKKKKKRETSIIIQRYK